MPATAVAATPAPVASSPPKQSSSSRSLPWRLRHTVVLTLMMIAGVLFPLLRPIDDPVNSWLAMMVLLTVFIITAGHGIKGVFRGALIDNRNKVSLSRLQMLGWTVLVVSALGVIGIERVIVNPATGLNIAVPEEIWLLMGLSLTSLIGSPLLKRTKAADTRFDVQLATNDTPAEARWADLFLGEEETTATYLDITKVQMFFFTVLVLLSYGIAIGASLEASVLPDRLPELGEGMLILLGLSHAGYLVGKATATPPGAPATPAQQPVKPVKTGPAADSSEASTGAGGVFRNLTQLSPSPDAEDETR